MTYPYRFPFSHFFAKCGATLSIRIEVIMDKEADVYIATSPDISGLVLESESFSGLRDEVSEAIPNLLELKNNTDYHHTSADVIYRDHIAIA